MNTAEKKVGKKSLLICCAAAGFTGTILTVLLMLIPAVLISHGTITQDMSDPLIMLCMIIGGLAAGLIMKSFGRGGAVQMGALGGLCVAVIMALVVAMRGSGAGFDVFSLKLLICGLIGGIFGGTLKSGKTRQKRKKHKK